MADREKLIELVAEAEEHSIDICVYNSDCKDCPGRKYGYKCREYLKADHLIANGVTVREHGRWEKIAHYPYYCSCCGEIAPLDCEGESHYKSNFCPNCGADMRGEEDGN